MRAPDDIFEVSASNRGTEQHTKRQRQSQDSTKNHGEKSSGYDIESSKCEDDNSSDLMSTSSEP